MKNYLIVGLIVLLAILVICGIGWFYYFMLTRIGGLLWLRLLIVLVTAGLISAMVLVGIERIREIDKEDQDDLGKY